MISSEEGNSILAQYMKFTRIYKEKTCEHGKTREAVIATLQECKEQDVLDYIEKHESEVISIMMSLYDRESYMKLFEKRKEKETVVKTLAGLVKDGLITVNEAAKRANLSVADFCEEAGITVAQ